MDQFYKTKLCPFLILQKCNKGDNCTYAHSDLELQTPKNLEKTKLCICWKRGECKNENCAYAHGYEELRSTEGYFKTTICALWLKGHCHLAGSCRHAHGKEELHEKTYKKTEKQRMQKNKKQCNTKNTQKVNNEKEAKEEEKASKNYVVNVSSGAKPKEKNKKIKRKKNEKHSNEEVVKVVEEKKLTKLFFNKNRPKEIYSSSYDYLSDSGKLEKHKIISHDDVSTDEEKLGDAHNNMTNAGFITSNVVSSFNTSIDIQSSRNTSICPSTTTECSSFISEVDYSLQENNTRCLSFSEDQGEKESISYRHENSYEEKHIENTDCSLSSSSLSTEPLMCENQNSKYLMIEAAPFLNESSVNNQSNVSFNSFVSCNSSNYYSLPPAEPTSAASNLFPLIFPCTHGYIPIIPPSHSSFSISNAFYNNMNMDSNISNNPNMNKTSVYCSHFNLNFYSSTNMSSFFYPQIFQSLSITAETLKNACNVKYED